MFLDAPVAGITPAPIAGAGYLDGLDLKSETFTVVGYGTDAFITGSAVSPKAITVFDGIRSYRDVSAIRRRMPSPTGSSRSRRASASGIPAVHCSTTGRSSR